MHVLRPSRRLPVFVSVEPGAVRRWLWAVAVLLAACSGEAEVGLHPVSAGPTLRLDAQQAERTADSRQSADGAYVDSGPGDTVDAGPDPDALQAADDDGGQGETSSADAGPDGGDAVADGADAEDQTPCLKVTPGEVDLGWVAVDTEATTTILLTPCGEEPLEITGVTLAGTSDAPGVSLSEAFALDLGGLPGVAPGTKDLPGGGSPVVLASGETASIEVSFGPAAASPLNAARVPIPDKQFLLISVQGWDGYGAIPLQAIAFDPVPSCAQPKIAAKVGLGDDATQQVFSGQLVDILTPLTLMALADEAMGPSTVSAIEWTVQAPAGSQADFIPSAQVSLPTFVLDVPGTYVFGLQVWSLNGTPCGTAEFVVTAQGGDGIRVELEWTTPDDPDQTDDAGSDLDLHFAHELATGSADADGDGVLDGWFDTPFDTFWANPNPNWGSYDPLADDDPVLENDDDDGLGPEIVVLPVPEAGRTYRVGVHYSSDNGFGPSQATVRIYIFGELAFESPEVELSDQDLWEVATITWPDGEVAPIVGGDGAPKIIASYPEVLIAY